MQIISEKNAKKAEDGRGGASFVRKSGGRPRKGLALIGKGLRSGNPPTPRAEKKVQRGSCTFDYLLLRNDLVLEFYFIQDAPFVGFVVHGLENDNKSCIRTDTAFTQLGDTGSKSVFSAFVGISFGVLVNN